MDKSCEVCGKLMTGSGVTEQTTVCSPGCLDAKRISEGKEPLWNPDELDPMLRLFYQRPNIPGATGKGTPRYNDRKPKASAGT